jgi:RNA polymerase sigma factor (sigma-70 family)
MLSRKRCCARSSAASSIEAGAGSALRWLLGITAHITIDSVRQRQRSRARESRWGHQAPERETLPHDQLESDETARVLQSALEQLPEASRLAIVLHVVLGVGYADVSAQLEVPIGTADGIAVDQRWLPCETLSLMAADGRRPRSRSRRW